MLPERHSTISDHSGFSRLQWTLSRFSPATLAGFPILAALFPPGDPPFIFGVLVAGSLAAAALGTVLLRASSLSAQQGGLLLFSIAAACLGAALLLTVVGRMNEPSKAPARSVVGFTCRLTDDAQRTSAGGYVYRGVLESVELADGATLRRSDTVVVRGGAWSLDWGRVVAVRGVLTPDANGNGGFTAFVDGTRIKPIGWVHPFFEARAEARRAVESHLALLRPEDSALLTALLLGSRDDLASQETYFFMHAGAVHILALSGMHLAVLSAILLHLLRPFGRRRATAATAILLAGYLLLAGPKISLVRAVIMFLIHSIARLLDRPVRTLDLLAIAFIICGLCAPQSATTISFRLSFLALLGILTLGVRLSDIAAPYLPRIIRLPLAASVAAQLFTLPLQAASFAKVQPAGFISSLLLSPLVTVYMWVGIGFLVMTFMHLLPLVHAAVPAISLLHSAILSSAEAFGRIPTIYLEDPRPIGIICVVCVGLAYLPVLVGRRQ